MGEAFGIKAPEKKVLLYQSLCVRVRARVIIIESRTS
jgi:hypothetical protein